ncbi:MAG: SLC13 family permease [Rhodospirillaceae bacterium]|nr:SLC13 family permease [Rhodospirillaceae bacterium]
MAGFETTMQMWAVLGLAVMLLTLYVTQWLSLEASSLLVLTILLLFFQIVPLTGTYDVNLLNAEVLLGGFSNPALIAVMALLVVGEGIVRTGALESLGSVISRTRLPNILLLALVLVLVGILSAFLNNTPIVLIFIPILQSIAQKSGLSASRTMLPLSYAAILGGMTTLVGSSTNLLISSSMSQQGLRPLTFFEITPLGLMLAGIAIFYVLFVLPLIMPERKGASSNVSGGRHYISQFVVPADSGLMGESALAGAFKSLPGLTVRKIFRRDKAILPPFDDYNIHAGDTFVVAATRQSLTKIVSRHHGIFHPPLPYGLDLQETRVKEYEEAAEENQEESPKDFDTVLVEAMITPTSRMVGLTLEQFELQQSQRAIFLGIQRRAQMTAARMTNIRLQSGDVLLLKGRPDRLEAMRPERDVVLISGTRDIIPNRTHARRAVAIFGLSIGCAALGVVSITTAAIAAATAMILAGCMNLRQAGRAIDRTIYLLVGTSLALGTAMTATGGAAYLANVIVGLFGSASPPVLLSVFFLVVALFTNVLSNNACAVLFTPIGVGLAANLGIDPRLFAITCLFACNCSFATPMGYQTNLLVMGPGQYQFSDFVRGGLPLVFVVWLAFSLIAPWFWGL